MKFIFLITLTILVQYSATLDCTVTLPRLLIGEKYANIQSSETALLMFDTIDDCSSVATLIPDQATPFKFTAKSPEHLLLENQKLDHNGKSEEIVNINKYTIIFALNVDVQKQYTVIIQGNKNDASTKYPQSQTFILPILGAQNSSQNKDGFKFIFFGDQDLTTNGNKNLNYLLSNTNKNKYDAMIFLGDYAYEFYSDNGQKGDEYVEKLSPLSFSYPLIMTPGNHEDNLNFSIFNKKFQMPQYSSNLNNYNSFNIGNVHFIHINLHFYATAEDDAQEKMTAWMKQDLSSVNRQNTPWVIAIGHRLIYCYESKKKNKECIEFAEEFEDIDSILSSYGVDVFVVGHKHHNQVMAPMAYQKMQDHQYDEKNNIIKKDQGYITIVQGNGGCKDTDRRMLSDLSSELKKSNLFLDEDNIGYGQIEIKNSTYLEYTSFDSLNNKVLVKFGIFSSHQSYSFQQIISYTIIFIILFFIF